MSAEVRGKEQKSVFVFPGQGSQMVGMGADLFRQFTVAQEVFQEVDEALHQNLSQLMFSGTIEELTQTQNAQPAIMAVSIALVRVLEKEIAPLYKLASAVAGHSLGEYTALCAANVLSLSQTACLLKARGEAMAKACQKVQGGMLALLGSTPTQAQEIAAQTGVYVANDNAPGQIVLSGSLENLDKAKAMADQIGVRRAILLQVSGAFHSPLMQSAADEMRPILNDAKFKLPKIPVYFNVTASLEEDPKKYADLLTQQIVAPVRWCELVQNMHATQFVECGSGDVLSGLIRRIVPEVNMSHIGVATELDGFIKNIKTN